MKGITFSALPAEIHVLIAKYCGKDDLINLCLTSKWVNERYLPVLYRHVELELDRYTHSHYHTDACNKLWQLVRTLVSHPEYGNHVRFLKTTLCMPSSIDERRVGISEEDLLRAMQSLTHIRSVELSSITMTSINRGMVPNELFKSATSVTLVGWMHYDLARSILNSINPAMLKHLCLDFVRDCRLAWPNSRIALVGGTVTREDGAIVTLGEVSSLLATLTGRCTALRTLILRRQGTHYEDESAWRRAVDEATFIDWGSFIRSVRGTVERFTYEHFDWPYECRPDDGQRWQAITDKKFERHILSAIVSGTWPCLTMMEMRGVSVLYSQGEKDALIMELRAIIGENTQFLVEEGEVRPIHLRAARPPFASLASFESDYRKHPSDFYKNPWYTGTAAGSW